MNFFKTHIGLLIAFVAVLLLLGLDIAIAFMPLGEFRIAAHLGSAVVMGAIVVTMWMDLRNTSATLRLFALGSLLWLTFMILLVPVDWLSR